MPSNGVNSGSTRAKQYADSDDITIEEAKTYIAQILSVTVDRDEAISSKDLGELVGLKSTTVRDLIPVIRNEHDMPIVACNQGYYQIQSVEDLERELNSIEEEIETRKQRKQELCKAFNRGGE